MRSHANLHQGQERDGREAGAQAGEEGTRESKNIHTYTALPKYLNKK